MRTSLLRYFTSFSIVLAGFLLYPNKLQGAAPCVAQISASKTTLCQGEEVVLQANTGGGLAYQWFYNGTEIQGATSGSYSAKVAGTYQVRVIGSACQSATSASIELISAPAPLFPQIMISPQAPQCTRTEIHFSVLAPQSGVQYEWYFGDGTTAKGADVIHIYWNEDIPGIKNYAVRVKAINSYGCETFSQREYQVKSVPQVAFKEKNGFKFCPQKEEVQNQRIYATISNATQEPFLHDITSYIIDWSDGSGEIRYSKEQFPVKNPISYPGPGNYPIRIRAIAANGCEAVFEETFRVLQKPDADFNYDVTLSSAVQGPVLAKVTVKNLSADNNLLYWGITPWDTDKNGPGEFTTENAVLEVEEAGVYQLYMVVSNGECVDTAMKSINILTGTPPTPGAITGPASVCEGSTVTYSIESVANATAYTWTVPSNWSIISGQGTRQIVVMAGAVSGHVSVKARNQYGESDDRQLEVTIAGLPARPGAITGPASFCSGQSAIYQVEAVDGAMAYTWTVPADWTITSGQGTTQLAVQTAPSGGEISVAAANACGQSSPSSLPVAASAPVTGNSIEGSQTVCAEERPAALSGAAPAGGNGTYTYSWESSLTGAHERFVPVSGANGQSFSPGGLSQTTWFRRAVNSGACETSYSNVIKLEVIPAITGNSISGDQALCGAGIPAILAGSTPAGGSGEYVYLWLASTEGPTTGFKTAPGDSLSLNYTPGELTQTTWFRRKVFSSACEVTSNVVKVEVKSVPGKPVVEQLGVRELRAGLEGEHYEWQRDGVVLPSNTRTISAEAPGAYRVRVRNAAGCFSPYSDVLQLTITGLAEEISTVGIALHPNPSAGKVNISTAVPLQQVKLQVIDPLGKVVYQRQLPQVQDVVELELSHLPDGVYLLLLNTPDRQRKLKLLLQH